MYDEIRNNKLKSYFLIFMFSLFVVVVAYVFAYVIGFTQYAFAFAIALSLIMAFFGYYKSDKIALKLSRAEPAGERKYKHLHNVVEGLAIAAGIPKPKVYVVNDSALNAFATGRNPDNSAVAVTTGLLDNLNRVELEGVIAHEMSHVKNYDIRFATLVVTMVGIVAILTDMIARSFFWSFGSRRSNRKNGGLVIIAGIIVMILAPIIANLIKLAVSRRREYLADSTGALLTRYPDGLASALEKIGKSSIEMKSANHATAHLFISNPFKKMDRFNLMFSTHPPIEDRIRILREM